jgi:hypothetical protein
MRTFISLTLAITASSVMAQGTFLYTWHGNQSLFQASFQIPADENQPGAYFESGMFRNTFTVISPDHVYPPSTFHSGDDASGFGPPLKISVTMQNIASGTGIHAFSTSTPGLFFIDEYRLADNSDIRHESGNWTFSQVPEPAPFSILILGLAAVSIREPRNRSA